MSLNKIAIYIERNTKIEYRKYTIYKATLYLKTILLKNVFLKRSVWMAGIAGDLFLKLYLVILVSGKLALRGWFGILETFLQILWSYSFFLLCFCFIYLLLLIFSNFVFNLERRLLYSSRNIFISCFYPRVASYLFRMTEEEINNAHPEHKNQLVEFMWSVDATKFHNELWQLWKVTQVTGVSLKF